MLFSLTAPAAASIGSLDVDKICYDTVACIKTSIENRSKEMNADYANAGILVASAFLAVLFEK
jgi:hypothetical protein